MTSPDPSTYTAETLNDLTLSPETLAHIAQHRPDLRAAVAKHPACYPALKEWIDQQAGSSAYAASGTDQVGEGAKKIAAEAKEFFQTNVAPAASSAAKNLRNATTAEYAKVKGSKDVAAWIPLAIPALGLLGLISLFLPFVSVTVDFLGDRRSQSITLFSEGMSGRGVMLLLLLLAVIVFGALSLLKQVAWAPLASHIAAAVAGLLGLFISIDALASLSSASSAGYDFGAKISPSIGLFLLLLVSLALLAAAALALWPRFAKAKQQPPAAPPSSTPPPSTPPSAPPSSTPPSTPPTTPEA